VPSTVSTCLEATIHFSTGQGTSSVAHRGHYDHVLKTVFDHLFEGRIIPHHNDFLAIVETQASIGWMPLFRGYWSTKWLRAHQNLVLTTLVLNVEDQKSRHKHQDQWLGKVASFVMRQVHQLWMLRNNERHGVTPAKKETRLRITVE
jgi:hypothetical protein